MNLVKVQTDKAIEDQKTVLITGCSSGFGNRLVSQFLRIGWRVIATMRRAEERRSLFSDEYNQYGESLVIVNLDMKSNTDRENILKVIESLSNPRIDCLINNAGYALFGAMENCSELQLREQNEVNFIGPMLLIRALLPYLRQSKGTIINVSSMMSFLGFPLSSSYCSSKAALTMLSESLKLELAPLGLRVHAVEPGGFRTGFVDHSQWGEKDIPAYQEQTRSFRTFQGKLSEGKGKDPALVVRHIVALATDHHSFVRKQVGLDALISKILHTSFPETIRLKCVEWMFRRIARSV